MQLWQQIKPLQVVLRITGSGKKLKEGSGTPHECGSHEMKECSPAIWQKNPEMSWKQWLCLWAKNGLVIHLFHSLLTDLNLQIDFAGRKGRAWSFTKSPIPIFSLDFICSGHLEEPYTVVFLWGAYSWNCNH